jgi:hypothetical protein
LDLNGYLGRFSFLDKCGCGGDEEGSCYRKIPDEKNQKGRKA